MSGSFLTRRLAPLAAVGLLALTPAVWPGAEACGHVPSETAEAGPSSVDPGQGLEVSDGPGHDAPRGRVGDGVGGGHTRGRSAPAGIVHRSLSSGPSARERRTRHLDFWMGDALARAGIPSWRPTAPPPLRRD